MVNTYHTNRILKHLNSVDDWITAHDLSSHCNLSTSQAANYLTSLVHLGLVERWERPWLNGVRLSSLYRSSGRTPNCDSAIQSKSS